MKFKTRRVELEGAHIVKPQDLCCACGSPIRKRHIAPVERRDVFLEGAPDLSPSEREKLLKSFCDSCFADEVANFARKGIEGHGEINK